jgi:probable F420-dependent oxidoreductase
MKFGVCLPTFRYGAEPTMEHLVRVVEAAEGSGYDSVWAGDHVLVPAEAKRMRFFADPFVTLAFVAGRSSTLLLGTSVVIAPLRNPLVLAKQAATLDFICNGRLILGLGAGWLQREFEYLGVPFHERGQRFDETLRILKAAWASVPAQFSGRFYTFDDAVLEPQPVQPGGPAIWIGGTSDRALRRAALLGDGWHADDLQASEVARVRERLSALAAPAGRKVDVSTRVTTRVMDVAMTSASAPTRAEGYYRGADAWSGIVGRGPELLEQVAEYAAAGSTHFIAQFEHQTVEQHVGAIRVFADVVIKPWRRDERQVLPRGDDA